MYKKNIIERTFIVIRGSWVALSQKTDGCVSLSGTLESCH